MFTLFASIFAWSFLLGKEDKPIDNNLLEKREVNGEEIYFLKNEKEPYTGRSVENYDNGKKLFATYSKGKWSGPAIEYYPNGIKSYEDLYENGKMVFAKSWKPDGSICDVTQAIDGNGVVQTYHPNGNTKLEGLYTDNVLQGMVKGYYPTGELKEEVMFADNMEEGPFKEYHINGNPKWEGTYRNGNKEFGLLNEFNEEGELIKKMLCDSNAICTTTWTIDGSHLKE